MWVAAISLACEVNSQRILKQILEPNVVVEVNKRRIVTHSEMGEKCKIKLLCYNFVFSPLQSSYL